VGSPSLNLLPFLLSFPIVPLRRFSLRNVGILKSRRGASAIPSLSLVRSLAPSHVRRSCSHYAKARALLRICMSPDPSDLNFSAVSFHFGAHSFLLHCFWRILVLRLKFFALTGVSNRNSDQATHGSVLFRFRPRSFFPPSLFFARPIFFVQSSVFARGRIKPL